MTMILDPTPENAALAEGVHRAMYADTVMLQAKAAMWKLGGIGVMLALTGAGAGAAFFGYSYLHDATNTADKLATAISKALETTNVTGETRIAPDQKVALDANGAMVKIDPPSEVTVTGTVGIDPNARVGINGGVPRPSPEQLRPNTLPPGASQNAKVVTNFTVFKSLSHQKGEVVSGWMFETSEQTSPSRQYCYYAEQVTNGVDLKIDLAVNGDMVPQVQNRGQLDVIQAAQQCVWYNGASTNLNLNQPVINQPAVRRDGKDPGEYRGHPSTHELPRGKVF